MVVFNPDGASLLALSRDINLWSVAERKKKWRVHPFSHPSDAVFSANGERIAVKNTSGQIVILDGTSGQTLIDFRNQSEGEGSNLCFSPTGTELIDGSWGGALTVRNATSGEIVFRRDFPGEMISRVLKSQNRGILLSEHKPKATSPDKPPADCYFIAWTWPFCTAKSERLSIRFPRVVCSALNHSGTELAVVFGAPPKRMVLVDLKSQVIIWEREVTLGGSGSALKWSPCQQYLAAVQKDRIAVYRTEDGAFLGCRSMKYPSDVEFSKDSTLIAFGSWQHGLIEPFTPESLSHDNELIPPSPPMKVEDILGKVVRKT